MNGSYHYLYSPGVIFSDVLINELKMVLDSPADGFLDAASDDVEVWQKYWAGDFSIDDWSLYDWTNFDGIISNTDIIPGELFASNIHQEDILYNWLTKDNIKEEWVYIDGVLQPVLIGEVIQDNVTVHKITITKTVTAFVPVTGITGVPTDATAGTPLNLTGTVAPSDATNQDIVWSVKNAGTTGATITGGNTRNTTAAGTVTVTATITNGASASTDYTKDFTITVNPFVPVTGISGVPATATAGTEKGLSYSVTPANATNKDVHLSIKDAVTTGVSSLVQAYAYIDGAFLSNVKFTATNAGTLVLTATIANGTAFGTDYTQDFTITVSAAPAINVQKILFKWYTSGSSRSFDLAATAGKQYTVDWGDGSPAETKTGTGNDQHLSHSYPGGGGFDVVVTGVTGDCLFTSMDCSLSQMSTLDVSGCTALTDLDCNSNQIITLNVSGCTSLTSLRCYTNQLTNLDVSGCTALSVLWCNNSLLSTLEVSDNNVFTDLLCTGNRLSLSKLFAISEKITGQNAKRLGTQYVFYETVETGTPYKPGEDVFNSTHTAFPKVLKGSVAAVPDVDYSINNGLITFKTTGKYTITTTNAAIVSNTANPAEVIVEIEVDDDDTGNEVVRRDVTKIKVYPNPTRNQLRITNYELQIEDYCVYNGMGQMVMQGKLQDDATIIHVGSLESGLYYLKIENQVIKFVKQ
jgi:hypothetical protein